MLWRVTSYTTNELSGVEPVFYEDVEAPTAVEARRIFLSRHPNLRSSQRVSITVGPVPEPPPSGRLPPPAGP